MLAAITLLALLPSAVASGPAAPLQQRATASELAVLASSGDAVQLWDAATRAAAAAVVSELRRQDPTNSAELKGIDLEQLRIWHGASLTLGLQADSQKYSFVVQSEQDWRSLPEVLPATQVSAFCARTQALAVGQAAGLSAQTERGQGGSAAASLHLEGRSANPLASSALPCLSGLALPCRAACYRGTTGTQSTETGCHLSAAAACCQTLLWRGPLMFTCSSPQHSRCVWFVGVCGRVFFVLWGHWRAVGSCSLCGLELLIPHEHCLPSASLACLPACLPPCSCSCRMPPTPGW
jgi:hypothetical protein